jgi:hypothetical protein
LVSLHSDDVNALKDRVDLFVEILDTIKKNINSPEDEHLKHLADKIALLIDKQKFLDDNPSVYDIDRFISKTEVIKIEYYLQKTGNWPDKEANIEYLKTAIEAIRLKTALYTNTRYQREIGDMEKLGNRIHVLLATKETGQPSITEKPSYLSGVEICPKCMFSYGWNGNTCSHCNYKKTN